MSQRKSRKRSQPSAAVPATRSFLIPALAALLVLAGAWAYAPSFSGVLLLDDISAIAWNPSTRTLWPPAESLSPPPGTTVSGRPVANWTFALNYALAPSDVRDVFAPASGRDPAGTTARFLRNVWGYHFLNLLIHLAAALALFGVMRRTLLSPRLRPRFEAAATWLAFVAALVWLVHPLQTQSVTYVVQRVESLMGLFYLLTLYCAMRGFASQPRWPWHAAGVIFCALGMGTKEVTVTAPLIVLLYDRIFVAGSFRRALRQSLSTRASSRARTPPCAR